MATSPGPTKEQYKKMSKRRENILLGIYRPSIFNYWITVGVVIASTAAANKNSLTTGTLTSSGIANHADYSATSPGIGVDGTLSKKH